MMIRRRGLLALGSLVALAPLLASCAVARDTRAVADYFRDRPHVRSVKDSYDTADADDQVNIDLELDEDVSADDVAALFADAEPALREATQFPVHVSASWSHHGVRMEQCAQAAFNSPGASSSYDDALVRASTEGALTAATETAQTVECAWNADQVGGGAPTLRYVVDHGSGDALPGDVALTLPRDLALDGYDVFLDQKVVLSNWEVSVTVTSQEGGPSAEGVPVTELAAALPPPTGYSSISVGYSTILPAQAPIGVVSEVTGKDELVTLGAAAVRALEGTGWRGALLVRGTGRGGLQDVVLDTSVSPTSVLSESESAAGLGEQILEQVRA